MVHGKNRISYRIDRRLSGLAGPDYDATISFGLPIEPEDSQYGKSRVYGPFCVSGPAVTAPRRRAVPYSVHMIRGSVYSPWAGHVCRPFLTPITWP